MVWCGVCGVLEGRSVGPAYFVSVEGKCAGKLPADVFNVLTFSRLGLAVWHCGVQLHFAVVVSTGLG